MNKNLIKLSMPIFEGKKVLNVGVKVNEKMRQEIEAISAVEDRPLSYIVRELAIRGLILYKQDGRLKATIEEENILTAAKQPNASPNIKPVIQKTDDQTEPHEVDKTKIAHAHESKRSKRRGNK